VVLVDLLEVNPEVLAMELEHLFQATLDQKIVEEEQVRVEAIEVLDLEEMAETEVVDEDIVLRE